MVNHTIHTCEQRVRFPLSAIVILFTILPLFSILHHTYTNLPISIHQTQTKNHITISLYNISVSILHSLLQNQNYIFIFSYHTHYYFLPNIYILSYLLLITTTIYIPTYNQNTPLSQIDIYLTYTIITYLLTLKIEPTYLFTYFILQLYEYTYPYFHTVYTIPYHYYFIITTSSLLLYHIVNIPYVYVHTYIHTYNHTYNHTQSYIQSLVLITTHIFI